MKHFKTIALALAISTGACTVQAAPQQPVAQRNLATEVNKWLILSGAAALAYLTTKGVKWPTWKHDLGNIINRFEDRRNHSETRKMIHKNRTMLKASGQAMTGMITFLLWRGVLNRMVGTN